MCWKMTIFAMLQLIWALGNKNINSFNMMFLRDIYVPLAQQLRFESGHICPNGIQGVKEVGGNNKQ